MDTSARLCLLFPETGGSAPRDNTNTHGLELSVDGLEVLTRVGFPSAGWDFFALD